MKCLFLYNPKSGRGKIRKKLPYIERRLKEKYDEVVSYATESGADLERAVAEGAKTYDLICFSGGDGTFNNVLHGLKEAQVPLAYIPGGTINDVARSLRIPRSVKGALDVILNGKERHLDCMRINGSHYAMYIAAAGAFTSATYTTPQNKKKYFGSLAYLVHAAKNNLKFDIFPVEVTCGEQTVSIDTVLVLTMNGRSVAGFPVNKHGSMVDGKLEAVFIKQVKKPNLFRKIGALFSLATLFVFGFGVKKKDLVQVSGEKITVKTGKDVVWDFDGEEGIRGSVEIEIAPGHVRMIVPDNRKKV